MSAYDPRFAPFGHQVLRWFGLGSPHGGPDAGAKPDNVHPPSDAKASDARTDARLHLLNDIGAFLISHQIEVNGFTLTLACDYLTGADPRLCRLIDARLQAGRPLTAEWLEEACNAARGSDDEREALSTLMLRIEGNLDEFTRTTGAARTAANDYSSALAVHVGELGRSRPASVVVGELATLARAMLNRTRELEKDMNRSDLQTQALRRSLNDARRSAAEDPLTGLPNRRSFEEQFARDYTEALAAGEPLCVAFCDIDNFKRVNDTHGHEAGDRVLRSVATNLARIADTRCHVARHGGEEFVILLRGHTLNEAWEILDEVRAQQAERRLVNRVNDTPFGKITFSGGVANVFTYPDPRAALRAADAALYRAKAEGRNRIVPADERASEASVCAA